MMNNLTITHTINLSWPCACFDETKALMDSFYVTHQDAINDLLYATHTHTHTTHTTQVITNIAAPAHCVDEVKHGVHRFHCREIPTADLIVTGLNFHPTVNRLLSAGTALCADVVTLSTTQLRCVGHSLESAAYVVHAEKTERNTTVQSDGADMVVYVPTLTETLSVTHSVTATQSVIPVCEPQAWIGVQCTCDGADELSLCGTASLHSHVCTDKKATHPHVVNGPAAATRECLKYRRCVVGVQLPDCLCLEAQDAALCSDYNSSTADGQCLDGRCKSILVCSAAKNITDDCTCTTAARLAPCRGDWVCDGNGACVEELEGLRVTVASAALTPKYAVPVTVWFETGVHSADGVSLRLDVAATADEVNIAPVPQCTNYTTPARHTIFLCPKGNLASGYAETMQLMIKPVQKGVDNVVVSAQLSSPSVKKLESRHSDRTVVMIPVADLEVRAWATGVGATPTPETYTYAHRYNVTNHGPTEAPNVTVSITSEGSVGARRVQATRRESMLSPGVPLEDGFDAFFSANVSVLYIVTSFAAVSQAPDPVPENSRAVVRLGPHLIAPATPWIEEARHGYTLVLSHDPWEDRRHTYPFYFMLKVSVMAVACWVVTRFRAPANTQGRLLVHTMRAPPAFTPAEPLQTLGAMYASPKQSGSASAAPVPPPAPS